MKRSCRVCITVFREDFSGSNILEVIFEPKRLQTVAPLPQFYFLTAKAGKCKKEIALRNISSFPKNSLSRKKVYPANILSVFILHGLFSHFLSKQSQDHEKEIP